MLLELLGRAEQAADLGIRGEQLVDERLRVGHDAAFFLRDGFAVARSAAMRSRSADAGSSEGS